MIILQNKSIGTVQYRRPFNPKLFEKGGKKNIHSGSIAHGKHQIFTNLFSLLENVYSYKKNIFLHPFVGKQGPCKHVEASCIANRGTEQAFFPKSKYIEVEQFCTQAKRIVFHSPACISYPLIFFSSSVLMKLEGGKSAHTCSPSGWVQVAQALVACIIPR